MYSYNRRIISYKFFASVRLNGKRTLAENIADNGGLRQAYKAFSAWKKNQLPTEKLPGLENFSTEQLFFLSYGSIWCTKYAKGMLNYTIKESDHAPAPYRLRITTENMEEFSESFKCHAKSQRQAVNHCLIW
ncbi:endothelin-converting enzyme homolog isoform X2 [Stegodyphus dumicola]|uniref:endothelin-converting enzyme homolog isoform X2 n=1 Tax=Stegodyphus dumicola TaxID=202533 RepID=UPI0015AE441F|nr:endothelin-converting enzyme homolog isoform X2 [Stegodyphus dumicola]